MFDALKGRVRVATGISKGTLVFEASGAILGRVVARVEHFGVEHAASLAVFIDEDVGTGRTATTITQATVPMHRIRQGKLEKAQAQ